MLTTFGILVSDTNRPAACATTLIVSFGVLPSLVEGAYIVLAVVVLVVAHERVVYRALNALGLEPEELR